MAPYQTHPPCRTAPELWPWWTSRCSTRSWSSSCKTRSLNIIKNPDTSNRNTNKSGARFRNDWININTDGYKNRIISCLCINKHTSMIKKCNLQAGGRIDCIQMHFTLSSCWFSVHMQMSLCGSLRANLANCLSVSSHISVCDQGNYHVNKADVQQ